MDLKKQDKALEEYNRLYNKNKLTLMDEIENIINRFDYESLNAYNSNLGQFKRETAKAIELDILTDYQLYMARKWLNKSRIKNKDLLDWYLIYAYAYFNHLMMEYELATIKKVNDHFIDETIKQCKKLTGKYLKYTGEGLLSEAMQEPNNLGYVWSTYKNSVTDYNSSEMYNDIIVQLREESKTGRKPRVNADLIDRQKGRIIKKKTFTGALENQIDWVTSYSQLEIFSKYGIKKVIVRGTKDGRTCAICYEYIGKTFNVDEIAIGEQVNSHANCRCYLEAVE